MKNTKLKIVETLRHVARAVRPSSFIAADHRLHPSSFALLCLCASAFVFTGCSTTNKQQMTDSVSGDGFYGTVSVPVTQSLKIGASMFIGRFNNTAILQPTSTNQLFAPQLVVYTKAHGKQSVGGAASSYAPGGSAATGTNALTSAVGLGVESPSATIADGSGDSSAIVTGDAVVTDQSGTNRVMTINTTIAPGN